MSFNSSPAFPPIMVAQTAKKTTVTVPLPAVAPSVIIAAANPKRRGLIIWNNSTNSIYVSLDATTIAASCTWIVPTFASKDYLGPSCYTGPISATRNAGSGTTTVWEIEEV